MKYSYKILKDIVNFIDLPEKVAEDIIMHIAEVEAIEFEGENLKEVFVGEVLETKKHENSEKLNICKVEVLGDKKQIVCGAENVKSGIKVPIAVVGAKLSRDFIIEKCKIRGETSEGMICSEDELGLVEERQSGIMVLDKDAKMGQSMRDYLGKSDAIIEIDNKGINHRPDMFSYIGLARELAAINNKKFEVGYEKIDFKDGNKNNLVIENAIPNIVKRYIGLGISGVSNIDSPEDLKRLINSSGNNSKGLLVDVSNYSLYYYGQPTHCFDANKIKGKIIIRFAKEDEEFISLENKTLKLTKEDIVIADEEKVLALGGVIGGKLSAVSDDTKNIVVEGAYFDPKTVRKTGRRHGIRTDSLNLFEKNIPLEFPICGVSLIYKKLKEIFPDLEITGFSDSYPEKQKEIKIPFDLKFINNLIGINYEEKDALDILEKLGIKLEKDNLIIPFWRKDLNYKADIAEEIARINGLDKIEKTVPRINIGAVIQDNIYKLKNDVREFFVDKGFFDLYNYSFVNNDLMERLGGNTDNLIPLKNSLTEDMTHMRGSLIPNLLKSLEDNRKQYSQLKLFEFEKVFCIGGNREVVENYNFSGVYMIDKEIIYYDLQNIISDLLKKLHIDKYFFKKSSNLPTFAHSERTADLIVRGQKVGVLGEISPRVVNNFSLNKRVGFFEIDADKLKTLVYNKVKTQEVSSFQENNFDLSFVVSKDKSGKNIEISIAKTNPKFIKKVELFDIYEDENKLPGKRSLSFKIYIQSVEGTLDDKFKNDLIKEIISKVEKVGGKLR